MSIYDRPIDLRLYCNNIERVHIWQAHLRLYWNNIERVHIWQVHLRLYCNNIESAHIWQAHLRLYCNNIERVHIWQVHLRLYCNNTESAHTCISQVSLYLTLLCNNTESHSRYTADYWWINICWRPSIHCDWVILCHVVCVLTYVPLVYRAMSYVQMDISMASSSSLFGKITYIWYQ